MTSKTKNKPVFIVLVGLLIASVLLNINFFTKISGENKVVEVVDGDTFQLKSGKRVRLMGVDAPEYDRCGGQQARERLASLILNKKVVLKEEVQETFGRTQALVYSGNDFINKIMISEGWAVPDYRKNSQRDVLTQSYHTAKNNQQGIFGALCRESQANPECNIKGNIDLASGKKFYHLPECPHYNQIVIDSYRGEQYFCNENEAQAAGFLKSSTCP